MTEARGGAGAARPHVYFPPAGDDDGWARRDPEGLGWDGARLAELLEYIERANSTGLVVLADGAVVVERYWRGSDRHTAGDVASVQKSVTSLLVGIARERGLLRLDDPVSAHLGDGWSNAPPDREGRITLRHLLTMTSGLDDDLGSEAEPGTAWYYNTPAYHLVKAVIEAASGRTIGEFSGEALFAPAGLRDTCWQDRPNMLAPRGARAAAAGEPSRPLSGLVTSTRDMARLGLLVLAGGTWAGRAVVDAEYLREAMSPSQALNPAYGYLWWLNSPSRYVLPGRGRGGDGSMIPSAPADLVCALGAGDKKVYVCPSLGLVVARHGAASGQDRSQALSSFDNEVWSRLMAALPR